MAVNLKALLRRYVEGDELGFRVPALPCHETAWQLLPHQLSSTHVNSAVPIA